MIYSKTVLLLSLLLGVGLLNAQTPAPVTSAFHKQFAGATHVRWSKEKNDFEVAFVLKGKEKSAIYDAQGNWKATEEPLPIAHIPLSAQQYLAKTYPGSRITETAKIQLSNGNTEFEAEAKGYDIFFDSYGKFLRAEKDED